VKTTWENGAGAGGAGTGWLTFTPPALQGHRWPLIEIRGSRSGPHLCVMAGVHVNEASSIEAAITLSRRIDPAAMTGRISIIPVVSQPSQYRYSVRSPVDDKDVHWLYPGNPDGTFSEALAHALLAEWAHDAVALIDLHGGDIGEIQAPYVVFQRTGDDRIDRRHEALARCFDTPLLVGLDPTAREKPGRSCTALGRRGRAGLVTESGNHAVLDWAAVDWHVRGIVNAARLFGILPGEVDVRRDDALIIDRYVFVTAPADGLYYPTHEPGIRVERGARLGELRDVFHHRITDVVAPAGGIVMWRSCLQFAKADSWIGAIGVPMA